MIIAPSMLAADYGRFAVEVQRAERAGADWLHIDIMDGHFVPNLTFGPGLIRTLRARTRLFLDVHLMCTRPETLLDAFAQAGADQITVHVELGERVPALFWKLRSLKKRVGLAINPPTAMAEVEPFLSQIDLLLVMTVNPGYGGQSFIEEVIPKIQQADTWRRQKRLSYRIEVDGGINFQTAAECARAGADTIVSGTALFQPRRMKAVLQKMRRIATQAAGARSGSGKSQLLLV